MNFNHAYQPMIYYKYRYIDDSIGYPLTCFNIMPNKYLIYSDGKVFNLKANRFVSTFNNQAGYSRIELQLLDGTTKKFSVHRLVGETFIVNPCPELFTDIDHIYGDKSDNYYLHLQWCSNNQNKHYASENGQYEHGENRYNSVYSDDFAKSICEQFQNGVPYEVIYKMYCNSKKEASTIGSFIYKLYHRKTRKHITDLYNY